MDCESGWVGEAGWNDRNFDLWIGDKLCENLVCNALHQQPCMFIGMGGVESSGTNHRDHPSCSPCPTSPSVTIFALNSQLVLSNLQVPTPTSLLPTQDARRSRVFATRHAIPTGQLLPSQVARDTARHPARVNFCTQVRMSRNNPPSRMFQLRTQVRFSCLVTSPMVFHQARLYLKQARLPTTI